jgi:hypothetical protein
MREIKLWTTESSKPPPLGLRIRPIWLFFAGGAGHILGRF